MKILVLGGAASGKSAFAERLICDRAKKRNAPLVYVATLNPDSGGDTKTRIQKHCAARADKGFSTVEWYDMTNVPTLCASDEKRGAERVSPVALIEDGGNLVANYLYPQGKPPLSCAVTAAADAIMTTLQQLFAQCADCVIVTNEISLGGDIPAGSRLYADVLAEVNVRLAAVCDEVYLVAAGIPIAVKN